MLLNRLITQFKDIAIKHDVSLDTVWDIRYFSRYKLSSLQSLALDAELGDAFDLIEDDVLNCIDTTYRTSSVIERFKRVT